MIGELVGPILPLDLQKPKKVVGVAAAHSIILLKVGVSPSGHTSLNLWRMERVIGRCGWGCLPALAAWNNKVKSTFKCFVIVHFYA